MIFAISIFSYSSISQFANAASDQTKISSEFCYNENQNALDCNNSVIYQTGSSYFSLMLVKEVVGGTASPDDFSLTVDGNQVLSGQENFYGVGAVLTIDETQQSDYIFLSITGEGCPTQLNESFILTQDTVCTITNIYCDDPISLTVIKEVVGGSASPDDFTLTVNGISWNSGQTSLHIEDTVLSLGESQQAGYFFSSITGNGCPTSLDESFTLTKDTVCTITNIFDPNTTLTVIKTIINDNGGTLTIGGVDLKIDGVSITNGTAKAITSGAYTVSETTIPGYTATIGGDCDAAGSITVALGDDAVCTITNDDDSDKPTLIVIKRILDGLASPDDFALTVNEIPVLSGESNIHIKDTVLSLGETQPPDYSFVNITGGIECPKQMDELFTLTQDTVCTITSSINPPVSLTVNIVVDGVTLSPEDIGLKVDGKLVHSGVEIFYKLNTELSIDETKQTGFDLSIKGNGSCPQDLDAPFTLLTDSVCTITLTTSSGGGRGGGHEEWDTRPTFGLSHEKLQTQMVENGFTFSSNSFTITDNHHFPFPEQTIEIGIPKTFEATVWADKGLKIQEFLFSVPEVGSGDEAETRVEVWFSTDGKIDDVKIKQKDPVIDISRLTVSHEKSKCLEKDIDEICDKTSIIAVFLEPLANKVMAIKAIDFKLRDQTTYLNDGFGISGSSLNPMKTMEIPSTLKGEGLITVTQTEKYSPYWVSENGRLFVKNNSDSFKQIDIKFERFQDDGTAYTRQHSEFERVMKYEQKRALQLFNATELISELPESFSYNISIKERITDEVKGKMATQEQIAEEFLETNYVQARW